MTSLKACSAYSNYGAHSLNLNSLGKDDDDILSAQASQDIENLFLISIAEVWSIGVQALKISDTRLRVRTVGYPHSNPTTENTHDILLDSWGETSEQLVAIAGGQHIAIVTDSAFLSDISDPRPLLLAYKKIAIKQPSQFIIVWRPAEGQRLRTWTLAEFLQFAHRSGFDTQVHDPQAQPHILIELKYNADNFKHSLEALKVNSCIANRAQMTLSVHLNVESLAQPFVIPLTHSLKTASTSIKLVSKRTPAHPSQSKNSVCIATLIGETSEHSQIFGVALLEAVKVCLFLVPTINICEFDDIQPRGLRLVQAKQTGQLPQNLWLRLYLLGSIDYRKHLEKTKSTIDYSDAELKESICSHYISHSVDECLTFSNEIPKVLQQEFGYTLKRLQTVVTAPLAATTNPASVEHIESAADIFQTSINENYVRAHTQTESKYDDEILKKPYPQITIATPIFNTHLQFLEDLYKSLNNSSVQPWEWLMIDDGSDEEHAESVYHFITSLSTKFKIRLVRQENKGPASARNLAIAECSTDYVLFVDSDDILLRSTISDHVAAIRISPDLLAVSGFAIRFTEQEPLGNDVQSVYETKCWMPLGVPEARSYSLYSNEFMSSCALMNVRLTCEAGGWDETDKAPWEDWSFYLKAAWLSYRFSVIPAMGFLYRNTPDSVTKKQNVYLGRRRLIRNIPGLTRLDANVIINFANYADPKTPDGQHRLQGLVDDLYSSTSWKATKPLRALQGFRSYISSGIKLRIKKLLKK